MTAAPDEVVVLGASVAGLGTALFLARRGVGVTVVDRDPAVAEPLADDVALAAGPTPLRRATPQAGHSHVFLAGLRKLLLDEAPDVLDHLYAAGVEDLPLAEGLPALLVDAPDPDGHLADPDLVALAARRSALEAGLRAAVLADDRITVVAGTTATDLVTERGPDAPRVTGIVVDFVDGTSDVLPATTVVDAMGRRTPLPGWLEARGMGPALRASECGISYLSRFYRRLPGAVRPVLGRGFTAGASFDGWSCLVFPGDHDTFSVTFGVLPEDRTLRGLTDGDAFTAAVQAIPALAEWVDPALAEPIGDVVTMSGMKNRVRRYVHHAQPVVVGLAAVGDAAATSNPAHSRGCSLALLHAASTAAVLADPTWTPACVERMRVLDEVLDQVLVPWVDDSVEQDAVRLARWRPGAAPAPERRDDRLSNGEAYGAAQRDPLAWRTFSRLQQLLATPDEVLADPAFVAHVRSLPPVSVPAVAGPTHDELAALVAERASGPVRRRGLVSA